MRCEHGMCEELRRQVSELEERVDVLTKGIEAVDKDGFHINLYAGGHPFIAACDMVAKYAPRAPNKG